MNRNKPLSRWARGRPPGAEGTGAAPSPRLAARFAPTLGLLAGVSVLALAACALFIPGFVLGAEAAPETAAVGSAAPLAATAVETASAQTPSEGTLLVALPWGDGELQVGLTQPADGLIRGPEALAVAPDGRVAVLDSVNGRVVFLSADGGWTGTASVPLAEPRFLAVDDDRLYVLDCDAERQLVALGWDGTILNALALPELADFVTGLFATARGACIEMAHDSVFLVADTSTAAEPATAAAATGRAAFGRASLKALAGRPVDRRLERAVKVTFAPAVGLRMQSFQIDRGSLKAKRTAESSPELAPGRAVEHLVSVDGDGSDGLIVGARLLYEAGDQPACLLLTRLASNGRGRGAGDSLLLAESTFAYLGQPYVVAPDGRVFQPVADGSGYSILVHSLGKAETASVAEEVLP